MGTEKQIDFK